MRVTGTVEAGTGTNSRIVANLPPHHFAPLGYTPHPGTLNIRVNPDDRAAVMARTGTTLGSVTYWAVTLDGQSCHVRTSRDPRTLEILHPARLRDHLSDGDQVTLTVTARPTVRLSCAIMAHPVREDSALAVQASLDRPAPIIWDENPVPSADRAQRWKVARRAWEAHDPTATAHLVLQDDILVARDLLAGLEQALTQFDSPDYLVSAYTGTGRPDQANVLRALTNADRHGHAWMTTRSLNWGPAIIAPTHTIPSMLDWCNRRGHRINLDKCIGLYMRDVLKLRTYYTVPSLVQTGEMPSLIGHDTGPKREAHRFLGTNQSAFDIDWTRTPKGGLTPHL